MRFVDVKAHVKEENFFPAYFAFGDDPYLIRRAEEIFRGGFSVLSEFNITILGENADAKMLIESAEVLPLLASRRLIIAPAFLMAGMDEYLKNPSGNSVILFLDNLEKPSKIAKNVEPIDCNRLTLPLALSFINIECNRLNCSIEPDAASLLAEYCARYCGRLLSELAKLSAYKLGQAITAEDIREIVAPSLEYKVFELTDAIIRRQTKRATLILEDMLMQTAVAAKVFGLIYSHFRRLLFAALTPDLNAISSAFSIKEYAAKMTLAQSKAFSKLRLKQLLDKLHSVDGAIKSFSTDKIVLSSFIYEVIAG